MGRVINEAKSSVKLQGMPGVMVKDKKEAMMLKRRPLKNNNRDTLIESTDSSEE
jgi:hypothetical protein